MNEETFIPPSARETAGTANIWAQQYKNGKPAEPINAYEAFLIYCELPYGKTPVTRSTRRMIEDKLVSVSKRTLESYSVKFDWQIRAFAYDKYVSALKQNARDVARFRNAERWTERKETVKDNEWRDATELRKKAKEFLAMPLIETKIVNQITGANGEPTIQHVTIAPVRGSLADVVRMLELADKLERNAVGAPTDRVHIETPESARQADVLKARAAFAESAALFQNKSEAERAESIAKAFNVTTTEILAPEEILPSIVVDTVSNLSN